MKTTKTTCTINQQSAKWTSQSKFIADIVAHPTLLADLTTPTPARLAQLPKSTAQRWLYQARLAVYLQIYRTIEAAPGRTTFA